jgi:hypothetical protein
MHRRLPRIAALSGAEAARAARVLVHSPVAVEPGARTWTLTLLDPDGAALAESRATAPDYPVPLVEITRVHLDVVGLEQRGPWHEQATDGGVPRFCAAVRAVPAAD